MTSEPDKDRAGRPPKRSVTGGRVTPSKQDQAAAKQDEAAARPPKRSVTAGRVTSPKQDEAAARPSRTASPAARRAEAKAAGKAASAAQVRKAARSGDPKKAAAAVGASARVTPRVPRSQLESPRWVPVLMFGLLILGMVLIFLNYIGWPLGDPSNARLIIGLALILGGILVATQYR